MNRSLPQRRGRVIPDRAEATDISKQDGLECRRNGEESEVWGRLGGNSG